jgi:hypothetical protein
MAHAVGGTKNERAEITVKYVAERKERGIPWIGPPGSGIWRDFISAAAILAGRHATTSEPVGPVNWFVTRTA